MGNAQHWGKAPNEVSQSPPGHQPSLEAQ